MPAPEPDAGEVLIAPEAIGVGGVDVMIRSGALADFGFEPGLI
ncbi:MAG: NADPH:quinone reductase, partial [Solirubrobacterales bacterium]